MGGRGSGSGFRSEMDEMIARIDAEYAEEEARARSAEEARAEARARADATPLSDEAKAVIARMTSRHHLLMSWARDYVRDDDDILEDVRAQAPGATGFHVRSTPDERGFATVEPEFDYTPWGRVTRTPTAAERREERRRSRERGASAAPASIRVRVIKNRDEERR